MEFRVETDEFSSVEKSMFFFATHGQEKILGTVHGS